MGWTLLLVSDTELLNPWNFLGDRRDFSSNEVNLSGLKTVLLIPEKTSRD